MKRAVVATAATLLIWSVQDILIWQRFFEGRPWTANADWYQYWHQTFFLLLIVLGCVWIRSPWALWFALASWTLANGGLADILYYLLALRPIPAALPWLDTLHPLILFHPATTGSVLTSVAVWVIFWCGTLVIVGIKDRRSAVA